MKRLRLTRTQYQELKDSLEWTRHNGFAGLQRFYEEELAFQAKRYALPPGSVEYRDVEDERPVHPREG